MSLDSSDRGWLTRKLRKAWALSWAEWRFLLQASGLFIAVEVGLKLLPFKSLLTLLEGRGSVGGEGRCEDRVGFHREARLVEVASRYHVLKPTCLKRALVLYGLLRRKGIAVELVIGATKAGGKLEAHAWLEHQGLVTLGGPEGEQYAPLHHVGGWETSPENIGR